MQVVRSYHTGKSFLMMGLLKEQVCFILFHGGSSPSWLKQHSKNTPSNNHEGVANCSTAEKTENNEITDPLNEGFKYKK